jgi:hypothetical protein
MDHGQWCSVLSVFSCSKHLVPKPTFHDLALRAATKTVPEGTGVRRGRGEGLHGGPSFLCFLCALGALGAKKILANMRDSDVLQRKAEIGAMRCNLLPDSNLRSC